MDGFHGFFLDELECESKCESKNESKCESKKRIKGKPRKENMLSHPPHPPPPPPPSLPVEFHPRAIEFTIEYIYLSREDRRLFSQSSNEYWCERYQNI